MDEVTLVKTHTQSEQAGGCRVSAPRLLRVAGAHAARVRLPAPGLCQRNLPTPSANPHNPDATDTVSDDSVAAIAEDISNDTTTDTEVTSQRSHH